MTRDFDVLIVGAGISGIGAAYHLQERFPARTYAILEGRERLGGTWDLFRYPGIRSDSDMYTLGFSFRPWTGDDAIADGATILEYLRDTAAAYGIDRHIRYRHTVEAARWSSAEARWTLDVRDGATGELVAYRARFLFAAAGYYDYAAGYTPELAGRARFRGPVVHPQHWDDGLDYAGKRVVVIGSGATAVTLVPALAQRGARVTMLQRSPTYIMSRPARDRIANLLRRYLPAQVAYDATRWKNVLLATAFYQYARRFPERAKKLLIGGVRRAVGDTVDVRTHFTPRYNPWDQRLCLVPDGDLFAALREGRVDIVTDEIETFTETGLRLRSGAELAADVIVTATGLRMKLLGGIAIDVDGKRVRGPDTMLYKGAMLSDVPNLAIAMGYTNASWTLKSELTAVYVCRVLEHMERGGFASVVPRTGAARTDEQPLIDLQSGYVQRAADELPRQGAAVPWRLHQNYVLDRRLLSRAPVEDPALEFRPPPAAAHAARAAS
ncbi:MAG: NAD(P)/FAD-dependent oxidoreductase [Deltaproteobacteria bacterium]|nr:NAD(P)/FAD-dependent oxidoreductase [Deltaproteobacteria bacterium]MCW5805406.1 NAD(P)/FAD-dependent oxidoreductase [Deltaproteobacteria bacterium]